MNDADRTAAEQQYSIAAFDYASNPIGSRDWTLYWEGWKAACEWLDSQAGEPYAYIYEFDSKQFGVRRSFSSNQWNGLNPSRCVLVYTTPPAAQINQQLVEALELAETEMRYAGWDFPVLDNLGRVEAYKAIIAALAATPK